MPRDYISWIAESFEFLNILDPNIITVFAIPILLYYSNSTTAFKKMIMKQNKFIRSWGSISITFFIYSARVYSSA